MAPPTTTGSLPHQSLIKKMLSRLLYMLIFWRYFLNGEPLFPNNSSLGQVEIKLARALGPFYVLRVWAVCRHQAGWGSSALSGMWKWLGRRMVGTQGEERGWHSLSKQDPVLGALGGWLCLSGSCCHIHSPLEVESCPGRWGQYGHEKCLPSSPPPTGTCLSPACPSLPTAICPGPSHPNTLRLRSSGLSVRSPGSGIRTLGIASCRGILCGC